MGMEEIVARQVDRAEGMTGRAFLLGVAGIVLRLALAQIACNLIIAATGAGLVNILFYLYAIWLLIGFMRRTVASYAYTLKAGTLVLQRQLGDSTTTVVEIPLGELISVRPVAAGERLRLCYRQVTVIDPAATPPRRVRAGIVLSLLSARLARAAAGANAAKQVGYAAVYRENGRVKACVFRPDEQMLAAMKQAVGERFLWDDRMARPKLTTLYARALRRAFPELYPHVSPMISDQDVTWARLEIIRQRERRADQKRGKARKKADEAQAAKQAEREARRAGAAGRRRGTAARDADEGRQGEKERQDGEKRRRRQE